MATAAARASRIHGQAGVDEALEVAPLVDAAAANVVDDDEDVAVAVEVDVEVEVDVDVEVEVVFVGGCVVDVGVDVDDAVEGDVGVVDRLGVVASALGGSVVRDTIGVRVGSVGAEIVRDVLGRFEPPLQDEARTKPANAIASVRNARSRSRRPSGPVTDPLDPRA